jgi:hypothetical protein
MSSHDFFGRLFNAAIEFLTSPPCQCLCHVNPKSAIPCPRNPAGAFTLAECRHFGHAWDCCHRCYCLRQCGKPAPRM